MCGIYNKLSSHQIEFSIAETAADRFVHRVVDDEGLRRRWSAAALAGRERFSRARFIAEQTRIYENFSRTSPSGPLAAVAAC
jgi:hypothetical protein